MLQIIMLSTLVIGRLLLLKNIFDEVTVVYRVDFKGKTLARLEQKETCLLVFMSEKVFLSIMQILSKE